MKLVTKNNDFDWLSDSFFNTIDFPYFKVGKNAQMMKTDIIEENDKYVFKVDIPGVEKEEIKVHLGENYLTVYVEEETKEKELNSSENKFLHQERFFTSCSRSFYVGDVPEEQIKANYKNGTLILSIPKVFSKEKEKKYITVE